MTIVPAVVIVPDASDAYDAMEKAEAILEISAIDPYAEGILNPLGRWESFAPGWVEYALPSDPKTGEEAEAIRIQDFDIEQFFLELEDEDCFIPEVLVMENGEWEDSETIALGVEWQDYFMGKVRSLTGNTWLVFVEADC